MLIFICLSLITDDAHRSRMKWTRERDRTRERGGRERRKKENDRGDEEEKEKRNLIRMSKRKIMFISFVRSSLLHLLQFFFRIQFQIMTTSRASIVNIHCPPSSSVHGWQVESGYYSDSYNNSTSSMSNNSKQHHSHTGNYR